ncbi:methyltransferase domain-containing protein [Candidatus Saccharibacteria bacterium]|nr:methyltransferase domain-containing protein [Candidatus Saccharibacteria bacterium]
MDAEQELKKRIDIINRYYNVDKLLSEKTDKKAVAKYYRKSDFFYNLIHSRGGGNIHMGLSDDGTFRKDDFLEQARFIDGLINDKTEKVLEVGAGKVANSKYLAMKHPSISFTALDLPHRSFKKNKVPANITLCEGDFNDLSDFEEGSFDFVFGVETICHSEDKSRTIKELSRVLKPGGKLIIFDVYEPKPRKKMTDFEKRVSSFTLASMRVTDVGQYIGDMKKILAKSGFSQIEVTDLTKQIRPSLLRLERLSGYYFNHPALLRFLKATIPRDATMNSIAGWLMPLTFDGRNIHQYNRIVGTKKL